MIGRAPLASKLAARARARSSPLHLPTRSTGFKEGHLSSVLRANNGGFTGTRSLARESSSKKGKSKLKRKKKEKCKEEKKKINILSVCQRQGCHSFHSAILKTFILQNSRDAFTDVNEVVTRLAHQHIITFFVPFRRHPLVRKS